MQFTFSGPPPLVRRTIRKYADLFAALKQRQGEWAAVPLDQIDGRTVEAKRSSLRASGKTHGVEIETSGHPPLIYIRVVGPLVRKSVAAKVQRILANAAAASTPSREPIAADPKPVGANPSLTLKKTDYPTH